MTHPKVLVRSEQSRGRIGIIESVMPPGATGPALHKTTSTRRSTSSRASSRSTSVAS
jgi:hypothetical protein